jgi:hypothetical protein
VVEWVQVLSAMVDGPSAPVTGVVSPEVPDDQRTFTFGWAGQPPLVVNTNTPVRMWRHGHRLRAELPSGEPASGPTALPPGNSATASAFAHLLDASCTSAPATF